MDARAVDALLAFAVERGASDVHIVHGTPPAYRVDGEIYRLDELPGSERLAAAFPDLNGPLDARDTEAAARVMLAAAGISYDEFAERKSADFAYHIGTGDRFRVNAYFNNGAPALACRVLPARIPSMQELFGMLPGVVPTIERFAQLPYGMVLVTGPTGSGKSTTLASMVDYINRRYRKHIVTLEDPIEYTYPHGKSIVNQRELGRDVISFADGLRAALREDPDVILVGEMRDLETVEIALHAAKTGHLVLSTLHTGSAAETVERIVSMFPPGQQATARLDLADALQGVITQQLVRKKDGGRVPAMEVLVVTPAVRNLIREGKPHQIPTAIQTGRDEGMVLMDKSLSELIRLGVVAEEDAWEKVVDKKRLAEYTKS
ncbi:MAG: type IV pilus twitching motility protein PilT [Moorellaceae bacterium]